MLVSPNLYCWCWHIIHDATGIVYTPIRIHACKITKSLEEKEKKVYLSQRHILGAFYLRSVSKGSPMGQANLDVVGLHKSATHQYAGWMEIPAGDFYVANKLYTFAAECVADT